jgi:hypothetical protein
MCPWSWGGGTRALVAACLAVAAWPGNAAGEEHVAAEPEGFAPVAVAIRNDTGGTLRCVVVLAHFVTVDVAPLAPGQALTLALDRDAGSGALGYGSHAGQPMLVETILCGLDGRWAATRFDLPLTPIRSGDAESYVADCVAAEGVACTLRP